MFPDEQSAVKWFEDVRWPNGRHCGHCGSCETKEVPNAKPMPYWCKDCRSYFSVRTGTNIEKSRLPLWKWVFAIYLFVTSLKGVSSMKLHRDLKVTQKTAWFMLHRLRESWENSGLEKFVGLFEVDETYVGGKRKNMSNAKRRPTQYMGRGSIGKTAVAGIQDRDTSHVTARVVQSTDKPTLQGFIRETVEPGSQVYTDESVSYSKLDGLEHEAINHSINECVRDQAHTNGVESFWRCSSGDASAPITT
ncbi:MAG: IS1595 family transposase [Paracoccaceae bacterium]|nr:IS1595 family transposase [Paracoccaceae bacterium]